MLDCLIIGSGLAGISAALTLKANGVDFRMVGKQNLSSKIEKAEKISNYPGLFSISGKAFLEALKAQLLGEEIQAEEERAVGVYATGDSFTTLFESGKSCESRTVVLAVGVESAGKISGEEKFLGRGVSYCATCDGALYKGKTIAVLSTSARFENEVKFLSSLASKVYFIPLYKNPTIDLPNTERLFKMPTEIVGEKRVEGLRFKDGELPIDGVFMLKESVPPQSLVGGLETENGHVKVGRDCSTNLKGLFAAGDCTGRPYQYAKAAGEGNVAAHAVTEFLRAREK